MEFSEFELRLAKHFTAPELVEFLEIDIETIIGLFFEEIDKNYDLLCEEIAYECSESSGD